MNSRNPALDPPPSALLVGTDEILLYTRKAILEQQGFRVSMVEPTEATDLLASSETIPSDVIIACHTLSQEEVDALGKAVSALPAKPAMIGFTKGAAPREPSPFDASVWSLASPESFVKTVHDVLQSPRTSAQVGSLPS